MNIVEFDEVQGDVAVDRPARSAVPSSFDGGREAMSGAELQNSRACMSDKFSHLTLLGSQAHVVRVERLNDCF